MEELDTGKKCGFYVVKESMEESKAQVEKKSKEKLDNTTNIICNKTFYNQDREKSNLPKKGMSILPKN